MATNAGIIARAIRDSLIGFCIVPQVMRTIYYQLNVTYVMNFIEANLGRNETNAHSNSPHSSVCRPCERASFLYKSLKTVK